MSDVGGFSKRDAGRIGRAVHSIERASKPGPASNVHTQHQRLERVKLNDDLIPGGEDGTGPSVSGNKLLPKSDGSEWIDTGVKIGPIEEPNSGATVKYKDDEVWVVSTMNRWVPIDESSEAWFVTYSNSQFAGEEGEYTPGQAETDTTEEDLQIKLCGNRDIENTSNDVVDDIVFVVSGSRVKKWHKVDTEDPYDEYDYPEQVDPEFSDLINGKWYDKLIGPGELVFCKRRVWQGPDGAKVYWMPLRGGATYFPFARTKEDIIDEGQVYVYVPKDPLNHLAAETEIYEYKVWPPEEKGYYRIEVLAVGPITREVIPAGTYVSLEWNAPSRKLIIRDIGCPVFELGTGTGT